jgi:uncharacterized protein (DUF433 family)
MRFAAGDVVSCGQSWLEEAREVSVMPSSDLRFEAPLYTLTEASRYLIVPRPTLTTWVEGYERRPADGMPVKKAPIVTAFSARKPGHARLPFIGVADPTLDRLAAQNVGPHALASKDLYTDGAEVLWHFAQQAGEGSPDDQVVKGLIIPRSGQYVFKDIVQHYLKQISFGHDKFAEMIRLPQYGDANVVLDPYRGYGQPIFSKSGAKVADALGPLRAGESFESVAQDYGVSEAELRAALDAIAA